VEQYKGAIKNYFPSDQHRTRLYARIDIAEGYSVEYIEFDKSAIHGKVNGLPDIGYAEQYQIWKGANNK
jgi:hypothetical protein